MSNVMALFSQLFSGIRTTSHKNHEYDSSRQDSQFIQEQVRLVLFKECDFRGRKLLFDSDTVQKVPVEKEDSPEKFVETFGDFGYIVITKPNSNYQQLSEMVFGSVAMSFRGTYLKIHSLNEPVRFMITQVFPSPHSKRSKVLSSRKNASLETNLNFMRRDDSGANSSFSTSDCLSDRSTASDTVLVCRRLHSSPLDVPLLSSNLNRNELVVDSGCADQSVSSGTTGPVSVPTWESIISHKDWFSASFSSNIIKRLLRSSTRSLNSSFSSLPNSSGHLPHKRHLKPSKLGLTVIIEIPSGKEQFLTQFFMEHISLLEAMIWRTHQHIEIAYRRPSSFISLMMDITKNVSIWLLNLVNTKCEVKNLWQWLSFDCDTSFNAFMCDLYRKSRDLCRTSQIQCRSRLLDFYSFSNATKRTRENTWFSSLRNISNAECDQIDTNVQSYGFYIARHFLKVFCELLEKLDTKDTNFFISTLLTAILTHHLGWVATVNPERNSEITELNSKQPYNALWSQFADLYGAIGYPPKSTQTVITGNNKDKTISRIINCLTYFIRFGDLERNEVVRSNIDKENDEANLIFIQNNYIPKEYFKKYEDHLREILPSASISFSNECNQKISTSLFLRDANGNDIAAKDISIHIKERNKTSITVSNALNKTKSSMKLSDLDFDVCESQQSSYPGSTDKGLKIINADVIRRKAVFNLNSLFEASKEKECDDDPHSYINQSTESSVDRYNDENVIFVLGDDEKLVGLKKDDEQMEKPATVKVKTKTEKQSSLNFSKYTEELIGNSVECPELRDTSSSTKSLTHSNSCEIICSDKGNEPMMRPLLTSRAQSEPPEIRKIPNPNFQYSRVKFNLKQYPQVVRNYMKSKNIELEGLSLGEKVFDKFVTVQNNIKLDLSGYDIDSEEVEALQTPSNASELEFSPDMGTCEVNESTKKEAAISDKITSFKQIRLITIPMPKFSVSCDKSYSLSYTSTLIKGVLETYMPDMVLHGTCHPKELWNSKLRNNLSINAQHPLLDLPVDEAMAIVANTDNWDVEVLSSHTYVIDKENSGVKSGMSQMVADMLESLLQMWKSHIPPKCCISHIEQRLQEICTRSRALAQLLLASEFCSIDILTSTLQIEVNDIPLLLAVASTHTPEVTRKYGLSFQ